MGLRDTKARAITAMAPLMPSRNSSLPTTISRRELPPVFCSSGEISGETRASAASRQILWDGWYSSLVRAWKAKGKCRGMRKRRVR